MRRRAMKLLYKAARLGNYAMYQLDEIEPKALFDFRADLARKGHTWTGIPVKMSDGETVGKVLSLFSFSGNLIGRPDIGTDAGMEVFWNDADGYTLGENYDAKVSAEAVTLIDGGTVRKSAEQRMDDLLASGGEMAYIEDPGYEALTGERLEYDDSADREEYLKAYNYIADHAGELFPDAANNLTPDELEQLVELVRADPVGVLAEMNKSVSRPLPGGGVAVTATIRSTKRLGW
jgi:hypothetical protein